MAFSFLYIHTESYQLLYERHTGKHYHLGKVEFHLKQGGEEGGEFIF